MIIEKVKFTAHFENGVMVAKWIGIEASPGFEETADECFKKTLDQVEKWSQMAGSHPAQQTPAGELPTIDRAEERLMDLLESAVTLEKLAQYKSKCTTDKLVNKYAQRVKAITHG